jgi:hypothetical protein
VIVVSFFGVLRIKSNTNRSKDLQTGSPGVAAPAKQNQKTKSGISARDVDMNSQGPEIGNQRR